MGFVHHTRLAFEQVARSAGFVHVGPELPVEEISIRSSASVGHCLAWASASSFASICITMDFDPAGLARVLATPFFPKTTKIKKNSLQSSAFVHDARANVAQSREVPGFGAYQLDRKRQSLEVASLPHFLIGPEFSEFGVLPLVAQGLRSLRLTRCRLERRHAPKCTLLPSS